MKSTIIPIVQRALREAQVQARARLMTYSEGNDRVLYDSAIQDVIEYNKAIEYMDGYDKMMKDCKEC